MASGRKRVVRPHRVSTPGAFRLRGSLKININQELSGCRASGYPEPAPSAQRRDGRVQAVLRAVRTSR